MIETLNRYINESEYTNKHIIYPTNFAGEINTQESKNKITGLKSVTPTNGILNCRLVLACDPSYHDHYGSDYWLYMIQKVMFVDFGYMDKVSTLLSVSAIVRFTSSFEETDPERLRSDFKDAMELRDELGLYLPRDAAHLFTGENLDGGTIGLSRIKVLNSPEAYSISQCLPEDGYAGWNDLRQVSVLFSHELGHIFNGVHANATSYKEGPLTVYTTMMAPWMGYSMREVFSDVNAKNMEKHAIKRLHEFRGGTDPPGNYFVLYAIDYFSNINPHHPSGGLSYAITTMYDTGSGYHFFGYLDQKYTADKNGNLNFTGWFAQQDLFPPHLQPNRRKVLVYALTPTGPLDILTSTKVLDHNDLPLTWYYIEGAISGLNPFQQVRFGVGRPDSWSTDWALHAYWAGINVFGGEYIPRTSPGGHYYNFSPINTPYGDGYHIDTSGSLEFGYHFYGYTIKTFLIPLGHSITVSGWIRHNDSLGDLAPGRRKTYVYLLDENGTILQKNLVLDYDDYPGWFPVNTTFSNLDYGIYRIGIGRRDSWADDWDLTVEWAGINVTIS
jgi:hypothetical protein